MTNVEDELRVLRSGLRNLEEKQRRAGDDSYRLQINQLKQMITERSTKGATLAASESSSARSK